MNPPPPIRPQTDSAEVSAADTLAAKRLGVFFSIYFGMTGVHAIHILGGMGVIAWLLWRCVARRFWTSVLWAGRFRRLVLAPGRPDLDLPIPTALFDRIAERDERNRKHNEPDDICDTCHHIASL